MMKTEILSADEKAIEKCGEIIARGGLVAFPTETVYGLGCDAYNGKAALDVFAAKGRPCDNPLIVHIADTEDIEKIAEPDDAAKKLIAAFMPGPFTLIMKKKPCIPAEVTAGLDTVAVRFPQSKTAQALIKAAKVPIAAPSANLSGRPSPTTAKHCIDDLSGRVDAILCGENCAIGVESTVVAIKDGKAVLCRPGKVTPEDIRNAGVELIVPENVNRTVGENERPISPGMKYKHYAPKGTLTLLDGDGALDALVRYKNEGCGIICFDEDLPLLSGKLTVSLGKKDDSDSHAEKLFSALRYFDDMKTEKIYSRLPSDKGVGLAVYNRILKAAGSRIEKL